ncbi:hypothetical protein EV360DRAFT_68355 [Lentinula raphanica]|nr:hypothetical protein EV360DRAFT_68355 [Lentinula raphanica]
MALPSSVGQVERCGSSESPGSASCSRSPSLSIRRSAVTPKGYIQSHGTRPDARDIQNEDSNMLLEETWAVCFETDCITSGIDSRHRNPDLRSVPSVQFFKNSVLTHHGHPSTRSLGAKVDWGAEDNRQAYYRRFKALPGKETLPLLNSILRILVDDRMLYTESATGKQVLEDLPSEWVKHDHAMMSAILTAQRASKQGQRASRQRAFRQGASRQRVSKQKQNLKAIPKKPGVPSISFRIELSEMNLLCYSPLHHWSPREVSRKLSGAPASSCRWCWVEIFEPPVSRSPFPLVLVVSCVSEDQYRFRTAARELFGSASHSALSVSLSEPRNFRCK